MGNQKISAGGATVSECNTKINEPTVTPKQVQQTDAAERLSLRQSLVVRVHSAIASVLVFWNQIRNGKITLRKWEVVFAMEEMYLVPKSKLSRLLGICHILSKQITDNPESPQRLKEDPALREFLAANQEMEIYFEQELIE